MFITCKGLVITVINKCYQVPEKVPCAPMHENKNIGQRHSEHVGHWTGIQVTRPPT